MLRERYDPMNLFAMVPTLSFEMEPILAQLDDTMYAAEVSVSLADLGKANAALLRAEADLIKIRADLYKAEREWSLRSDK